MQNQAEFVHKVFTVVFIGGVLPFTFRLGFQSTFCYSIVSFSLASFSFKLVSSFLSALTLCFLFLCSVFMFCSGLFLVSSVVAIPLYFPLFFLRSVLRFFVLLLCFAFLRSSFA